MSDDESVIVDDHVNSRLPIKKHIKWRNNQDEFAPKAPSRRQSFDGGLVGPIIYFNGSYDLETFVFLFCYIIHDLAHDEEPKGT